MRNEFLKKVEKTFVENKIKIKALESAVKNLEESEEIKAIEDEIEFLRNPFPKGYLKAYHCVKNNDGFPILDDVLFDSEVPGFAKGIEDAGFSEFIMTCQASGMIDLMTALDMKGWRFKCLSSVYKNLGTELKRYNGITFKKLDT